jgi:hypothetical protein
MRESKKKFGGIRRDKNGDNGDRTHDIMQIPGLASVQSMRATAAPYPPEAILLVELKFDLYTHIPPRAQITQGCIEF